MKITLADRLTKDEKQTINSKVHELSQLKIRYTFFSFAFEWALITLTVYLSESFFSVGIYLLSIFVIGSRQHALAILAHEGVHGRLFKSKKANVVFSNLFASYPLLYQIEVYASSHLLHHRYTNEDLDPDRILHRELFDWQFPMSFKKIILLLILDLTGRGAYLNFERAKRYSGKSHHANSVKEELSESRWIRISFYIGLAIALTALSGWKIYFLYWIVPSFFVLPAFLRFRNMCEHYGLNWSEELQGTRDVVCNPVEAFVLAPYSINYHLIHHLYPSIPYYNLKQMHRFLLDFDYFKDHAHINKSYVFPYGVSVIKDLTRSPIATR